MNSAFDVQLDIPGERDMPAARMAARESLLEQYATAKPRRQLFRSRPRLLMGAALGVALLLSSGAVAYRQWAPAAVHDQVRCYTAASLEGGDDAFFGTTAAQAQAADGRPQENLSPVEVCAMLWRVGLLQPNKKQLGTPQPDADYPVPPLVACTLHNGIAAVFPGDERTCMQLGLPRLG